MQNYFDAPPEGAIPGATERPPKITYRAGKTPEHYAKQTEQNKEVEEGRLGFRFYDKDLQSNVFLQAFTFIVLDVYAGVSGFEEGADRNTSYWSNRVKDTRKEEMIVWRSGQDGAFMRGLYAGKKSDTEPATVGGKPLPKAAKYTKFAKVFCIQLNRVCEIELSQGVERAMQRAVAKSTGAEDKWNKVWTLGLADNDHIWGFSLTGYRRVTKQGDDYAGKGELFFEPVFHCGIVNPSLRPDEHKKYVEMQNAEKALHEQYKAKNAAVTASEVEPSSGPTAYADQPIRTNITARHEPEHFDVGNVAVPSAPPGAPAFPDNAPAETDDLPF